MFGISNNLTYTSSCPSNEKVYWQILTMFVTVWQKSIKDYTFDYKNAQKNLQTGIYPRARIYMYKNRITIFEFGRIWTLLEFISYYVTIVEFTKYRVKFQNLTILYNSSHNYIMKGSFRLFHQNFYDE